MNDLFTMPNFQPHIIPKSESRADGCVHRDSEVLTQAVPYRNISVVHIENRLSQVFIELYH